MSVGESCVKVAGSSASGAGAVEQRCPICLEDYDDKTFIDACFHCFCFRCIVQWSQVTTTCPMCKTSFSSLIHNVQANDNYTQYKVEPRARSSDLEISLGEARRFRYRTTRVPGQARTSAPEQQEDGRERESLPSGERERERRERERGERRAALQQLSNPSSDERRRVVYSLGLWAQPPQTEGRRERVREISAVFFQQNPACTHRLVPWLTREFQVLLGPEHVQFMIQLVLSLIDKIDLEREEFQEHLQPFLLTRTSHFLHELVSFAQSPFNMAAYDHRVCYEWPVDRLRDEWDPEATVNVVTEQLQHSPLPGTSGFSLSDERLFHELTATRWDDSPPSLHLYSPILIHGSDSESSGDENTHTSCGTISTGGTTCTTSADIAISTGGTTSTGAACGSTSACTDGAISSGTTRTSTGSAVSMTRDVDGVGERATAGGSENEGGSGQRAEGGSKDDEEGGGGEGEGIGGAHKGERCDESTDNGDGTGSKRMQKDSAKEDNTRENDERKYQPNSPQMTKEVSKELKTAKSDVITSSVCPTLPAAVLEQAHSPLHDGSTSLITSTTPPTTCRSSSLMYTEAQVREDEKETCIVINAESENEGLSLETATGTFGSVGTSVLKPKGKRPAGKDSSRNGAAMSSREKCVRCSVDRKKHKSSHKESGCEIKSEERKQKVRGRQRCSRKKHRSSGEHHSRSHHSRSHSRSGNRRQCRHSWRRRRSDRYYSSSESLSDTEHRNLSPERREKRRKRNRRSISRERDEGYFAREKSHRSRLYSDDIVYSKTASEFKVRPSSGKRMVDVDSAPTDSSRTIQASVHKPRRKNLHARHSRNRGRESTKLHEELSSLDQEIAEHKREVLRAMLRSERLKLLHRQLRGEDLPGDELHSLRQPLVINETTPTGEVVQQLAELDRAIVDGKRRVLHVMKKMEEQTIGSDQDSSN